jgi:hypothetical protein
VTWTKLSDTDLDAPRFVTLPRGVRLMHVEALVWCNRFGTDGAIPRHALRRLTDEDDVDLAAKLLVDVEAWAVTDEGWQIVDFLRNQRSAEDVERTAALNRARQRRNAQHKNGDHSLCDPKYCRAAANALDNAADNGVTNTAPTRPDLTRPVRAKGKAGRSSGATPSESSPPDSPQWDFGTTTRRSTGSVR